MDRLQKRKGKIRFNLGTEIKAFEGYISEEDGVYVVIEDCGREHRIPKFKAIVTFLPEVVAR